MQGPEKECMNLHESLKESICSQNPCKEDFDPQESLKECMDFEGSAEQFLDYKDFARFYQGMYTVEISINATTLMHKSTLSRNNFGNNHFGRKYQQQNILRIFVDYKGVCLKNFQRREQKLENAFLAKFSILLTIS